MGKGSGEVGNVVGPFVTVPKEMLFLMPIGKLVIVKVF